MKNKTLIKLVAFALCMVAIRVIHTGSMAFLFMFWNLFLALIPVWLLQLSLRQQKVRNRLLLLGVAFIFLPNAPYMITDLFHLAKDLKAPMWYDLTLLFTFALLGLVCFVYTASGILAALTEKTNSKPLIHLTRVSLLLLSGYGIYLGRYLRFNSWDLLTNPFHLFYKMQQSVFSSGHYKETISISLTFAVFLYLVLELYEGIQANRQKS